MKTILSVLVLSLVLSGCSLYHLDSEDTTLDYYPPKASLKDVAYIPNVSRNYVVIGKAFANGERRQLNAGETAHKLKMEAAKLGGDAITNIETDATGVWKKLPGQKLIGNAFVRANFRADVVVFK